MEGNQNDSFDHGIETAVVTGAIGTVGSWIVDRLADRGIQVVGIDLERPSGTRYNAEFRAVDLKRHGATWETIYETDPDAVIHVAAIAGPFQDPGTMIFENNVMSTYNVLVAAGRIGASVVSISSQAVYGTLYARKPWLPDYFPIDEDHEFRPEDAYGTSKVCGEEIAKMVARRFEVPVTSIRPASIFAPGHHRLRPHREGFDLKTDRLSGNFCSYVDVRDVARMVEAALAADVTGHEAFLCVDDDNYLGEPTADLIEAAAGTLPDRCNLNDTASALSNEKAKSILGWTPKYSWHAREDGDPNTIEWL